MNRKTLIVLAVAAVVAALLAVVGHRVERGSASGGALAGNRFLPDLEASLNEADAVAILTAGGIEAVTLERRDEIWTVAQQDGYPADFARLRDGLVALAEATVVEEKTANPGFYDRLGVEPIESESAAGTGVRIRAGERELASVVLGGESGPDGRFAREADAATSVLIDRDPDFPADPTQWLVPDLVDVRGDRIQAVEIAHADGERLVVAKSSREETNFGVDAVPDGRELQYASVANVTGNALRELRLEGARAAVAVDDPAVTTEFRTFDGLVVTVTGVEADGAPWIGLAARYDAEQAARFADPAAAGADSGDEAAGVAGGGETADAGGDAAEAVRAEAETINARTSGWQFRIPSHIYSQMTRRMEDLLKAPAESTDAAEE